MFVGRSDLLKSIDRQVVVSDAATKPVLLIQGCGGSGRTSLLETVAAHWQPKTPTVLVRPMEFVRDDRHTVLGAIMLGLSLGAPGYELAFHRVVLAHIAMKEDFAGLEATVAIDRLRERIAGYQANPALLIAFLTDLVNHIGSLIGLPAPATAASLAGSIASRLQRARRGANPALTAAKQWYSHQGQGLSHEWELELVRLSDRSRSKTAQILRAVDDLLVAALLADIRYSVAGISGRPANIVVLLDDADLPPVTAFLCSLLKARSAIANVSDNPEGELPDPLVIAAVTSGPLAAELSRERFPAGAWLPMPLPDLTASEVLLLANAAVWPDDIVGAMVGPPVYRLTRGHPGSTVLLINQLRSEPGLLGDMDGLLRSHARGSDVPLEQQLLFPFAQALHRRKSLDPAVLAGMIILSAARNRLESYVLKRLLPAPIELDSPLFTSPTLWVGEREHLYPLVRYLGIRALAAREHEHPASWSVVFNRLRASADQPGQWHHGRMLGAKMTIADDLVALLPQLSSAAWLELFDEVTATADPRERDIDVIRAADQPSTVVGHTIRLLGVIPALVHDPCVAKQADIEALTAHARHSYLQLANAEGVTDPPPFIFRADAYRTS